LEIKTQHLSVTKSVRPKSRIRSFCHCARQRAFQTQNTSGK